MTQNTLVLIGRYNDSDSETLNTVIFLSGRETQGRLSQRSLFYYLNETKIFFGPIVTL